MANRSLIEQAPVAVSAGDDRRADRAGLATRRDRTIRYERNGTLYATDGRVGVLQQVVVDDDSGEVVELVVKIDGSDRVVLLPTDLVDTTAGSAVFVNVNRVQFAERTAAALVFNREGFARFDVKSLLKNLTEHRPRRPRRTVIAAGRDYVETPVGHSRGRLDRSPANAPPTPPSGPPKKDSPSSGVGVVSSNERRVLFGRS